MEWNIIFDEAFRDWLYEQEETVQDSILAYIGLLKQKGPLLGRPYVDTLQGSRYPNLKELRVQHQGQPWRVLFAFDPIRQAIMLVGGNKTGDKRWYEKNIPIAEKRFEAYLKTLTEQNL
ncbi:hypothetical protein NIES3806_09310 [Microcystis aeruginosa NIES-3806]|jgi:hypothetical protein|uniref:YPPCP.09C homologue n=8 Tax=Microcystis TaxID=1125 RepID=A0A0A1VP08_MICAE|nr:MULTISPECIES: type II toxin-antitoxin system RelE/ParE family toxin [Microcystis]MCZ8359081.1 type II toxin-antitoxin system RelE/ParE family toxin [Microcystis sp. LE19-388.1G]NCR56238.1 type II toxin-antitoxin system RelE/ParE family toxin [Microcystis aeruginosa L211-07]REJ49965.1 MAG: type II toxin-antitoxin system RelE/ParE family toxin [Microcystis aeruginosa TA09]TRV43606.1 MAG: type II toxin-antitoxin system RelE/ParE family toxin [Microcystis panniformis Mp_GB_SS_20050300_S99D]TRV4